MSPDFKTRVQKIISVYSQDLSYVRWVNKKNCHITLKFLGETDVLPETIMNVLGQTCVSLWPFNLTFGSLSFLANALIIDIKKSKDLTHLFYMTNKTLKSLGFRNENHAFHPHLTLGRYKKKTPQLSKIPQFKLPFIPVRCITLFESKLIQSGSTYVSLGTIDLAA